MSETSLPLITRYRPEAWDEVIGHTTEIAVLRRAVEAATRPHAYLFTGPSGTGKTTLARILGTDLHADLLEIDAVSNNGVDAMRTLVEFGQHTSMVGDGTRMILLDECHALSKQAWQAILKLLEDPPAHLYIALCTTEADKIPETIQTRCFTTILRRLAPNDISDLLDAIAGLQNWTVHADVLALIVDAADGSPRKAITLLQKLYSVESRAEAKRIIDLVDASDPVIKLLQLFVAGKRPWNLVREQLRRIEDSDFETVSIASGRYITSVLLNTDDEKKARALWSMLDALVFPTSTYDKKVAFIAAIGRIMWGG